MGWTTWRLCNYPTDNYENYEIRVDNISGDTEVRNIRSKKNMTISLGKKNGRQKTHLTPTDKFQSKTVQIHRLVAYSFISWKYSDTILDVAHKNGNKIDNRPENLYFATRQQNMDDNKIHKINMGSNNHSSKIESDIAAISIRLILDINKSIRSEKSKYKIFAENSLSKQFNLSPTTIGSLRKKHTWNHLDSLQGIDTYNKVKKIITDYIQFILAENHQQLNILRDLEKRLIEIENKYSMLIKSINSMTKNHT